MKGNIVVRSYRESDLADVTRVEASCFTHPWSGESIAQDAANSFSKYLVCERGGEIVGYLGARIVLDEAEITNIAVMEAHRGIGAAKRMLNDFITYCIDCGASVINLEVRAGNGAAIGLYESFGFQRVSERRDYYTSPREDAILYTKFLR